IRLEGEGGGTLRSALDPVVHVGDTVLPFEDPGAFPSILIVLLHIGVPIRVRDPLAQRSCTLRSAPARRIGVRVFGRAGG
ncbi:MAG TPA: hypothetical protein VE288_07855, partial [Rubrobacteraceae bacterium]|nr:hypothetical protein [Rubrobacteraceae bacterium]